MAETIGIERPGARLGYEFNLQQPATKLLWFYICKLIPLLPNFEAIYLTRKSIIPKNLEIADKNSPMIKREGAASIEQSLFKELLQLIEQSQRQVLTHANNTLTILFWQIEQRINGEILENKRAEYAKQILSTLSTKLIRLDGFALSL
ncbi:DUF1016 N-terminal domain-containing protein [Chitinophaga sp. OAE865]|uniref:DUF1016 N-terminal domain-containing protein n=1 Tax=Chitinophaga sp. OAE865 TaxID=2817898 RepID=UPI001AEAE9E4